MFDAIIVGARCAGSACAIELTRRGYRVLLVDKATFPSDTLSTHILWPTAMASLASLGVRERVVASGCPKIERFEYHLPMTTLRGFPPGCDGVREVYAPRRRVLDSILVNAACESGAELWDGTSVRALSFDGDRVVGIEAETKKGQAVSARARVVIGADGMSSFVARSVKAPEYHCVRSLSSWYYSYWSGLPSSLEFYPREGRHAVLIPTNDDLVCLAAGWRGNELPPGEPDAAILSSLEAIHPELAQRVRAAKREEKVYGTTNLPNFFRKPYGKGWALIGDAGYHKDPLTGHGIPDALSHGRMLAAALDDVFARDRPIDEALGEFERTRNERVTPTYEYTVWRAQLLPMSTGFEQFIREVEKSQERVDRLFGVLAGTTPVYEIFPMVPRVHEIAPREEMR